MPVFISEEVTYVTNFHTSQVGKFHFRDALSEIREESKQTSSLQCYIKPLVTKVTNEIIYLHDVASITYLGS